MPWTAMAWRKRICDQRMQIHVMPPNIEMSETKYLKTVRAEVAQAQSGDERTVDQRLARAREMPRERKATYRQGRRRGCRGRASSRGYRGSRPWQR
jgi:hypothetical protein